MSQDGEGALWASGCGCDDGSGMLLAVRSRMNGPRVPVSWNLPRPDEIQRGEDEPRHYRCCCCHT